ncbi:hypothetical protein BMJ19_31990 [Sinorhizobium medicae]|uniref:His/Gly/Thr/Pro-type tRNA ligase C-terminal domain-containing protein n=1 Tax=Sinorhizobium medicae TaxID=110321 RepID=UPI000C7D0C95|nr:His/Gly/Thr/Pro-type tRNA ligase C-terminal domain-containing protein [Sinorhizobium medicae]PLU75760.1 hypothetical protein BMJ19_31990 [Sinorhizobium medicae]
MRLSRFFMPILKENPKEAEIVSHRLMLRTGMIRQQSAGIYTWLPLGKRVLDKVKGERLSARGIEVGHIFYFGTKYSEAMGAKVLGPDGKEHTVHMGSYGIGPTRLVPAIIEASHDDNGIIWPKGIAPFDIVVINMKTGDDACDTACGRLYSDLGKAGFDVLLDDTDERAGGKFATADIIGVPVQVIVGPRSIANGEVEVKDRKTGARETMTVEAAINKLVAAR